MITNATRTTTLFAALNVLNGKVIAECQPRHRHAEWLKFLKKINRETPKDKTLHLIATTPPPTNILSCKRGVNVIKLREDLHSIAA